MTDIEGIIRGIVREELERALGLAGSGPTTVATPSSAGERETQDTRLLLDVADVAEAVNMSRQYVRNDIRAGKLVARLAGKKFLLDRREVTRYAEWLSAGRP
jgi:hypothetical protein